MKFQEIKANAEAYEALHGTLKELVKLWKQGKPSMRTHELMSKLASVMQDLDSGVKVERPCKECLAKAKRIAELEAQLDGPSDSLKSA